MNLAKILQWFSENRVTHIKLSWPQGGWAIVKRKGFRDSLPHLYKRKRKLGGYFVCGSKRCTRDQGKWFWFDSCRVEKLTASQFQQFMEDHIEYFF